MQKPTKDDVARDLAADLATCDTATPGPWFTVELPLRLSFVVSEKDASGWPWCGGGPVGGGGRLHP